MHWSLDGFANSCLCVTAWKDRHTRDQRGGQKCWSLDSVSWTEHFSSKIALKVRIIDVRIAPALQKPRNISNSCVCNTTRKYRDTHDQRGTQEMLESRQRSLDRALQLENCTQSAKQRCTYGTGVTSSVACMPHSYKTSWHNSTSVLSRELGTTTHQAPGFVFPRSVYLHVILKEGPRKKAIVARAWFLIQLVMMILATALGDNSSREDLLYQTVLFKTTYRYTRIS